MDLDKFERFISNSFRNVGQGFYDSYVEANVRFRSKLGMKEVIVRRQLGNCCKWCADLAGIYDANNRPADIYKRHRNCRCLVTHKTEKQYEDVWSGEKFKTQKEARYARIKQLEKVNNELRKDNLKARQSKKLGDLVNDIYNNSSFVTTKFGKEVKKKKLASKLKMLGFSKEYHVAKVPENIGGGNVYLRIKDLAYILIRHSDQIPLDCYSKIAEVIEDYDILFRDKKYNSGYKFFKVYDSPEGEYALDVAIVEKYKNKNEYIVHFCFTGTRHKKNKVVNKKNRIMNEQDIIDVKKR